MLSILISLLLLVGPSIWLIVEFESMLLLSAHDGKTCELSMQAGGQSCMGVGFQSALELRNDNRSPLGSEKSHLFHTPGRMLEL